MSNARDRTYHNGLVQITRHYLDWNDLGPGLSDIARATSKRLEAPPILEGGHSYMNPMFTIIAPGSVPSNRFLAEARRACSIWMKQLKQVAGRAAIRRFQTRDSSPADRMLVTSGILMISGQMAHPKRMHDA